MTQRVFDGRGTEFGAVHADTHTHGVGFRSGFVAKNQQRILGAGKNAVGDGAQEEARKRRAAARTHDDEVSRKARGFLGDLFRGITHDKGFGDFDTLGLQIFAGGLKDLFGFVFVVTHQGVLAHQTRGAGGQGIQNDQKFDFSRGTQECRTGSDKRERVLTVGTAVNGNEDFHRLVSFTRIILSLRFSAFVSVA